MHVLDATSLSRSPVAGWGRRSPAFCVHVLQLAFSFSLDKLGQARSPIGPAGAPLPSFSLPLPLARASIGRPIDIIGRWVHARGCRSRIGPKRRDRTSSSGWSCSLPALSCSRRARAPAGEPIKAGRRAGGRELRARATDDPVVVVALRSLQLQARPARAPRARLQCWLGFRRRPCNSTAS
jgi:hypothetical protein